MRGWFLRGDDVEGSGRSPPPQAPPDGAPQKDRPVKLEVDQPEMIAMISA
jgi:hypothetical protein